MSLVITYSNADAQQWSKKGAVIPLYAFALQGVPFTQGNVFQVGSGKISRFYTGVTLNSLPPNTYGLIVPHVNYSAIAFTMVHGSKVIQGDPNPISLDMVCISGSTLVEYGQHIADLYFIRGIE